VHQFYITPRNQRADESIFRAEQLFNEGNYEKALNGDSLGIGFLQVIDQYGNTKAGNIACLYAAKCYAATEKYQEAIDMLGKFDACGDAMISPAATALKGNCYAELGENRRLPTCSSRLPERLTTIPLAPLASSKPDNSMLPSDKRKRPSTATSRLRASISRTASTTKSTSTSRLHNKGKREK